MTNNKNVEKKKIWKKYFFKNFFYIILKCFFSLNMFKSFNYK